MRALALAFLLVSGGAAACPGLEVADPWVAEGPPGAAALAGYATLRNTGPGPLVLDRLTSPEFGSVMLHETVITNGMAHMEHLDHLDLGVAHLAPGHLHLMLMGPRRALKAGDAVKIRFMCGPHARTVTFPVRKEAP